jgi:hypothetical protein
VPHNAGERSIEKPMQCLLDVVKVVLMDAVEQATVDQAKSIGVADLNGKAEKSAGTPNAMPLPTDGSSRFSHDHSLLRTVTRYNITGLVAYRCSKGTGCHHRIVECHDPLSNRTPGGQHWPSSSTQVPW